MSRAKFLLEKFDAYPLGTKIQVKQGQSHGGPKSGKIGLIAKEPVYGIYFSENPKKLHKWYAHSEIKKGK